MNDKKEKKDCIDFLPVWFVYLLQFKLTEVSYFAGGQYNARLCCSFLAHWLTLKVLVATIDAQWEGMGDVGSARYEPALLPPCPTIRVISYSILVHFRKFSTLRVNSVDWGEGKLLIARQQCAQQQWHTLRRIWAVNYTVLTVHGTSPVV